MSAYASGDNDFYQNRSPVVDVEMAALEYQTLPNFPQKS